MEISRSVKSNSKLEFSIILDALLANPESYVNFGEYWWTLKRMLADWVDENGSEANPALIRGSGTPRLSVEVEESEVYRFLEEFSGVEDFLDWISYVNPRLIWDDRLGEETNLEDPEWEENFL